MKLLSRFCSSRWDIAFLKESMQDVISGKTLHFIEPKNPYKEVSWFADPFILDVTDSEVFVLVEEMHQGIDKGRIAKLTIDKCSWTITNVQIILEEPWHLSFPFILRKDGKIYVAPESANGHAWYLYELIQDQNGTDKLIRVEKLCDDVVWDSIITNYWGEQLMFTAAQNDFYLDIYGFDQQKKLFTHKESIQSNKQNMRMAGDLFEVNNDIYCPSQNSRPGSYGEAVEIKRITNSSSWTLDTIRKIKTPRGVLNDGIHTFNEYKGLIVVDIHRQSTLLSLLVKNLVIIKKAIVRKLK